MATVAAQVVQLTDDAGRVLWLPREVVTTLVARGEREIVLHVRLSDSPAVEQLRRDEWLTVSEAARLHLKDIAEFDAGSDDERTALSAGKAAISHACDAGQIASTGHGFKRRIDPASLDAWRLKRRDKMIERENRAL